MRSDQVVNPTPLPHQMHRYAPLYIPSRPRRKEPSGSHLLWAVVREMRSGLKISCPAVSVFLAIRLLVATLGCIILCIFQDISDPPHEDSKTQTGFSEELRHRSFMSVERQWRLVGHGLRDNSPYQQHGSRSLDFCATLNASSGRS